MDVSPRKAPRRATSPAQRAACVLAALAAGSVAAQPATGLPPGNSEQPITLEAASSDFDYRNNSLQFTRVHITQGDLDVTAQQASATGLEFENSEWRLTGQVTIRVPGGMLRSDEARVQFRNNEIVRAAIRGSPADFEQQLREDGQLARGRASAIDYDVKQRTVQLQGDAWLSDGRNEIAGSTLVYDIARERVQANPGQRDPRGVRITINPPKKPADERAAPGAGT